MIIISFMYYNLFRHAYYMGDICYGDIMILNKPSRAHFMTGVVVVVVFAQVIVNNEEVSQLIEATGASYEQANQAYIVSKYVVV